MICTCRRGVIRLVDRIVVITRLYTCPVCVERLGEVGCLRNCWGRMSWLVYRNWHRKLVNTIWWDEWIIERLSHLQRGIEKFRTVDLLGMILRHCNVEWNNGLDGKQWEDNEWVHRKLSEVGLWEKRSRNDSLDPELPPRLPAVSAGLLQWSWKPPSISNSSFCSIL